MKENVPMSTRFRKTLRPYCVCGLPQPYCRFSVFLRFYLQLKTYDLQLPKACQRASLGCRFLSAVP